MGQNKEVVYKYIIPEDYEPEYINGIYGGLSPNGELVLNFFMDRFPIPLEARHAINEIGQVDNKTIQENNEDIKIRRVIKQGVMMSPNTAVSIYHWLKERLIEMGVNEDDL